MLTHAEVDEFYGRGRGRGETRAARRARARCRDLAHLIVETVPPGQDLAAALSHLADVAHRVARAHTTR